MKNLDNPSDEPLENYLSFKTNADIFELHKFERSTDSLG